MMLAIRVDCNSTLGTGHVLRSRSLADAAHALGMDVVFVTRVEDAASSAVFTSFPYRVIPIAASGEENRVRNSRPKWDDSDAHDADIAWQKDADETAFALGQLKPAWVCVDHYSLDADWHERVRSRLDCRILAIDDLGDRSIAADILLDANVSHDHAAKYRGRLTPSVRSLFGPRFALLAPAYQNQRHYIFSEEVRSIGIFMGGTDPHGASEVILRECRAGALFTGPLEIVTTSANPRLASLREACARDSNTTLTLDLPNLTSFYSRHDLQIGAGGASSYERSYLGVPTIAVVLAANQLATVPILHDLGVVRGATVPDLKISGQLTAFPALRTVLTDLIHDPGTRHALARNARNLVDGRGAERVALKLLADTLILRPARIEDAETIYEWRNHPATREVSITKEGIAYDDHVGWLRTVLGSFNRRLFIAMIGPLPVGVIRFDMLADCIWEVSLYTDPELNGLGIGKRMLAAGEEAIAMANDRHVEFRAEVVPGNTASMMMFERAGYSGSPAQLVKIRRNGEKE